MKFKCWIIYIILNTHHNNYVHQRDEIIILRIWLKIDNNIMLSRVLTDFVMNNFRRSCTRAYIHERVYNYLLSCLLLKAGLLTTWPIELLFFLERAQLAGDAATLGYVLTGLDASKNWPWRRTRAKHTPQVYNLYIYMATSTCARV